MPDQEIPDIASTAPMKLQPYLGEVSVTEVSVTNDEIIYRSVQLIPQFFRWGEDDEIKVSASAFNDRKFEPSFYRKNLCESPPDNKPPRMNPDDAVAEIMVGAIRAQDAIPFQSGTESKPIEHKMDVRSETSNHHKAHVVVFTAPEFKTKGGFAKLKELLAQIVGSRWAIRPNDVFLAENNEQIPRR